MKKNNIKNQRGVTILISILILSSVVILALAVADIVGRSNRISKDIGLSEVAYFAAERGVEEALYQVERDRTIEGLEISSEQSLVDIPDAKWTRSYRLLNDEEAGGVLSCGDPAWNNSDEGACVNNNPKKMSVNLAAGHTFQLEMDFMGFDLPDAFMIKGVDKSNSSTTLLRINGEEVMQTEEEYKTININPDELVVFNIVNKSATLKNVEIKAKKGGADINFPLSILITSTGTYKEQKRVIEVERRSWQIY
jgi:hypothetical protein